MKTIFTFLFFACISITAIAQQFQWANSYDISNCNEVAAIDADSEGNIYIAGVHDAPVNLPYKGPAYIQKTDPSGQTLWTDELNGLIQIGDMATVGDKILIIGQSDWPFSYRDEQYGEGQYFMFVIMLDENGDVLWHFSDVTKFGSYTNIALGNTGDIALHIRGQYNLGDWIYVVDPDGNILQQKHISAQFTMVMDIAYWDGKVYFNGSFNGPGSTMVDTILVELPDFENASITMGFDENLTAQWLYTGQTINNQTGKIIAGENGLYVYEPLIDQFFNTINSLKYFDFDGELRNETDIPFYSSFTTIRPDLTVSPSMIGLMARNSFGESNHIVFLYDHELNLLAEKEIIGSSGFRSGQISHFQDDFFVSHIHSGNLNFDDEISLDYTGSENCPYIAKVKTTSTDIAESPGSDIPFLIYPNPAAQFISVELPGNILSGSKLVITDASGKMILEAQTTGPTTRIDVNQLPAGLYFVEAKTNSGIMRQKILKY